MNFAVGSAILILAMTTLAGCSGGGGGDEDPGVDFTGFSDMPESGTVIFEGTTRSSSLKLTAASGVTMSSPSGPNATKASVTTQNDNLLAVGIDAPGASVSFGPGNEATFQDDGSYISVETGDREGFMHLVDSQKVGYEYQTFGVWYTGLGTSSGNVGVGSFGAKTTTQGMPGGAASYNGSSLGTMRDENGDVYTTVSEVNVYTDFSTASISSTSTDKRLLGTSSWVSASSIDFSGRGPVSDTGFTAQVTGVRNGNLTGDANGQFYGTSAQEVGGTFGLETSGGQTYIGSFGAGY